MKNLGLILALVGALMLIISGFNFVTKKEVADLGPVEIKKEQNHNVHWPPIAGIGIMIAGVAIYMVNKNKV